MKPRYRALKLVQKKEQTFLIREIAVLIFRFLIPPVKIPALSEQPPRMVYPALVLRLARIQTPRPTNGQLELCSQGSTSPLSSFNLLPEWEIPLFLMIHCNFLLVHKQDGKTANSLFLNQFTS